VSVSNTAAVAGLNDTLRGSLSGSAGGLNASGNLAGVGAGQTDTSSLVVQLSTANAGVFSGTATVALASHNPDMADLSLGSQTVQMSGQVNNYAEAGLAKVGGQGSFSGGLNSYSLDFGTLTLGAGGLSANLNVLNLALGVADALRGFFELGNVGLGDTFSLSGFNSFSDIAAGNAFSGLTVNFGTGLLGDFTKTVVLKSFGTNASGYDGALADVELRLHGQIVDTTPVPEPETWALMALGLGLMLAAARRRQARAAA
jgi:PEP-CTERM motif